MADKNLSSIIGSSGVLILGPFTTAKRLALGASGDIIIITPPTGKRAVLTGLSTDSLTELGITVTVGTRTIVDAKTLVSDSANEPDEFSIGTMSSNAASQSPGNLQMIVGKADEVITINKDAGSTLRAINYSSASAE